ncbi:hypothetical protein pb186bvf_004505 [Paramecium bursaria]
MILVQVSSGFRFHNVSIVISQLSLTQVNHPHIKICHNLAKYQYGLGYCSGYYGYDVVGLDKLKQKQLILFVNYEEDNDGMQADGIMGLSNDIYYENLFDLAYKNKQIKSNRYAFEIKEYPLQSLFHYDDIPENILNKTKWLPVVKTYYWAVGVQYIKVNGYYATIDEGTYALIDTGTTGLYFNDDIFQKSYQLLTTDGMCYYYEQDFFCPCYPSAEQIENFPHFQILTTDGTLLEIPYTSYILYQTERLGYCVLAIFQNNMYSSKYPIFILGDAFMRNYVVTYDKTNQQIGLTDSIQLKRFNTYVYLIVSAIGALVIIISIVLFSWKYSALL